MKESKTEILKLSDNQKFKENPFLGQDYLKIERGTRTVIAGSTRKMLMDSDTGEMEGITLIHKTKEVDKTQFVKLFLGEVGALFDLSKAGLKTFGYILQCLKPNEDDVYVYMPDFMDYAGWASHSQAYRGLGELLANKIIAVSVRPGFFYINPNIVFNGDRIAFIKEYRMKQPKPQVKQLKAFEGQE